LVHIAIVSIPVKMLGKKNKQTVIVHSLLNTHQQPLKKGKLFFSEMMASFRQHGFYHFFHNGSDGSRLVKFKARVGA